MRCKNCGWPNKPGASNCSKCGSPLVDESPAQEMPSQSPSPAHSEGGAPMGGTVFEGSVFPSFSSDNNQPQPQPQAPAPEPAPAGNGTAPLGPQDAAPHRQKVCPKCGYPLRPDADKCPNCKFQIAAPKPVQDIRREGGAPGMSRRPTVVGNQTGFADQPRAARGTVNPYLSGFQPEFILTPVARATEVVKPEPQCYTGDSVVLNRDNTDPDNPSITSREQAVITRKGNQWFISDRSSLKTTFVQASGEIEIHEGDLILMGNRIFVFSEKPQGGE